MGVSQRAKEVASAALAAVLVARLAPSPAAAMRTLATAAQLALRAGTLRREGRTLPVRIGVHTFQVSDPTDLQVLREVWHMRIYDRADEAMPDVVVDVGANLGATVAFFKERWPSVPVHAFEPDPVSFDKLSRGVGDLPGVTLHQAALGPEDGEIEFWSSSAGWQSSALGPHGSGATPVQVQQRSLRSALALAGSPERALLKLDAEGAEFAVLPDVAAERGIRTVLAELHFDLVESARLSDVTAALAGFDLDLIGDSRRRVELVARRADDRP